MYLTISSLKKTYGKYMELNDIIIGMSFLFLIMILFTLNIPFFYLIFLGVFFIFLMLPISISKKNRMYKFMYLLIMYIVSCKLYLKRGE